MLILLVTCIGFTAFTFSSETPQFRCQLTSLLLLTLVNFRWILSSSIPSISYQTLLDKYSMGSIIFLFALFIWHTFAGTLHNEFSLVSTLFIVDDSSTSLITSNGTTSANTFVAGSRLARLYDKYMFYGFMIFYFVFNLVFLVVFVRILRSITSIHDKHKTTY